MLIGPQYIVAKILSVRLPCTTDRTSINGPDNIPCGRGPFRLRRLWAIASWLRLCVGRDRSHKLPHIGEVHRWAGSCLFISVFRLAFAQRDQHRPLDGQMRQFLILIQSRERPEW